MSQQESSAYEIAVLYEEARTRRQEGNSSGAFARYRRLLELADEREDPRGRAELLAEIGEMYQRMCETVPAKHWFQQALSAFEALDDSEAAARVRLNLGEIALVEGALYIAREHFKAAHQVASVEVSGLATAQLGSLALMQNEEVEGLRLLCDAFSSLRERPVDRDLVRRHFERWVRQLTPARFRRLLGRSTTDTALRAEIERLVL